MPHQSPFHQMHLKSNAEMAEQNSWLVPLHYGDPQAELRACRNSLAVFDLSHHSRVRVSGAGAKEFLTSILTLDRGLPSSGRQMRLKLPEKLANPHSTVTLQHQAKDYLLILEDVDHISWTSRLNDCSSSGWVDIQDETEATAMISVQGPIALSLVKEKLSIDIDDIQANDVITENMFFMKFILSLDDRNPPGINLILPAKIAPLAWDALQKYGRDYDAQLAGVQAWQSL